MQFNNENLNSLKEIYNTMTQSKLAIVLGEKGIGKSEIINRFLRNCENVINISPIYKSAYLLQPIADALNVYSVRHNCELNAYVDLKDFNYSEHILDLMFSICNNNPKTVICFEKINQYIEYDFLLYVKQIISNLVVINSTLQTFIILTIDTDDIKDPMNTKFIDTFYSLTTDIEFIKFKKVNDDILKAYILEVFDNNIIISEENLHYIIKSSFGNPTYLKIIINYLKQEELISRQNGIWICSNFEKGIFALILRDHIINRYESLDEDLKKILKQSSVIGSEIEKKLLIKPFDIIDADRKLKQIENISRLLLGKENDKYTFENDEVHFSIAKLVPDSEKREWNDILARYYEQKLNKENTREYFNAVTQLISSTHRVAYHYEEAKNVAAALYHYLRLLPLYEDIMDYTTLLKAILKIKKFNEILCDDEDLNSILAILEANSLMCLGKYSNAIVAFEFYINECKSILDENAENELIYSIAYCNYNNSDSLKALKMLLDLKNKLKRKDRKSRLFIKTLSLISSAYDLQEKNEKAIRYFNWTMDQAYKLDLEDEYYAQLRKANMVLDGDLALPMIKNAIEYFESKQNNKEAAKAMHNYGNELLYYLNYSDAEIFLKKSADIFKSYHTNDIRCPLNSLGIIEFLNGANYKDSLKVFQTLQNTENEVFSQITIMTNIASCYRMLKRYNECFDMLGRCSSIIIKNTKENIPLLNLYLEINIGLYYKELLQYGKALESFKKAFEISSMPELYKKLAAVNIYKLSRMLDLSIDPKVDECSKMKCLPLCDEFIRQNVILADFMFWE